jgi:sugar/nucleoside kinase (ribokinase family)
MTKDFQVCGLGNAIVDIFVELPEAEFAATGFERGTMRLVEGPEQQELLTKFHAQEPRLASGGSVANSLIGFSQLGGKAAFIGCIGDDRYGLFYQSEFVQLGIELGNSLIVGETSGTSVCLITPDAERTMRTSLAVASHLAAKHIDERRIASSEWLFVEGYVFANPETGQGAIRKAIEVAKAHGVKVAVTCSDAFIPHVFGDPLKEALAHADLLFCNAAEAVALTGAGSAHAAFAALATVVPNVVVTDGPHGAHVRWHGEESFAPAFACEPKDLTGAGDMFAGAFLYGVTHGVPAAKAARAANFLCTKVITQVGARLHHGTRGFWDDALAQS